MTRIFRSSAHTTVHRTSAAWQAAVIGATVLALTGCAGPSAAGPTPSTHPHAKPAVTSTPTPTPAETCPDSETQGPWGDVVAAEHLTDAAGAYCHTTIDPAAAQFDPSVVDLDSLTAHGFTLADAEAAQHSAVSYVAEQGLDSSRLDDYSTPDSAWFDMEKGLFSTAAQARFAPLVESFGLRDAGVIITQSLPAPLHRDGGPRAASTEISVDKIFATLDVDQVTPLLVVRVPFTATYDATDASIVDAAIRNERGTTNLTEESLSASTPSLFDGADDAGLLLAGSFNVGFGTGDTAAIAYIGTAWTLTTGDDALQIDAVEPEMDPAQR